MTNPSDGRITSLTTFVGSLTGSELFLIVSPPDPASAINYKCPASTLALLVTQSFNPTTANFFFAGPTSGNATAVPAFRAMVLADVPAGTASLALVGNGATTAPSYQTLGAAGFTTGTAGLPWVANGATTNSSYQLLGLLGGGIGTNAIATGNIPVGNNTAAMSQVVSTTAGYPLVANGSGVAPSYQAANLASTFVTGILSVPNGGIGTSALATNAIVLGNDGAAIKTLAGTTAGYFLVSNGSTSAPIWSGPAGTTTVQTPANPGGTSNTASYVMAGLGTTCKITPNISTRVFVSFEGGIQNTTTGDGTAYKLFYGVGTPPTNGAAATGTLIGASSLGFGATGANPVPFCKNAIATSLTNGSTYWFDLAQLASGGGTASFVNLTFVGSEI